MMLSLDTAYRSFGGEVEASSTPTICRLPDSRRHQLSAIARMVTRDCEVVQMPFQHLFHPSPGFRNRVVQNPAQLDFDRQQLGSHPFLDRLAPDDERTPLA